MSAEEIAALSPAADDADELAASKPEISAEAARPHDEPVQIAAIRASLPPAPVRMKLPEAPPQPQPETAEAAAERERCYQEIFGIPEPKRRRWRR